jgi:hypothetical protein
MRHAKLLLGALVVSLGLCGTLGAQSIEGEYIEARTCDVWTGPCFSNAEINIRGNQAVLAWAVTRGSFNGTALDGLKAALVLDAEGTLDSDREGKVKAALYLDASATPAQAEALTAMVRKLAGARAANLVAVEHKSITYSRDGLSARLTVGMGEARIVTTALAHCDAHCGNEEQAYPAIGTTAPVDCAKAVELTYAGDTIKRVRWTLRNTRSALLGKFAL